MQSAALANMALLNLRVLVVWHLFWSLWCYSVTYVDIKPLPGLSYVVDYVIEPVLDVFLAQETSEDWVTRIKQANAVPYLAALLFTLMLVLLLTTWNIAGLSKVAAPYMQPLLRRIGLGAPEGVLTCNTTCPLWQVFPKQLHR